MSDYEIEAMLAKDLAEGELRGLRLGEWSVLIVRTGDQFYALNDRCSHAAARLSCGRLRRTAVMCPLHGALFNVSNGLCRNDNYPPVRIFPVRVQEGIVLVTLPRPSPDLNEIPKDR